ncbi:MAG: Ig-like domain-containing protein, partial [Thermoplasmata archaeon]|nr:Ig-like domain-containing protein [Thermoplasmata archaeon]
VVAILQGYSMSGASVLVPTNSVVWVNLTMYESTALVCGYVKNTDGEPLEQATVNLIDDKSINLGGYTTDEEGYFEAPTHPGAFILVAKEEDVEFLDSGEYDTYIDEIVVPADTKIWANVTLQEAGLATMTISLTFIDWDHLMQEGRSSMTFNQTCETRLFFDSYVGNGDLSLSQAELTEITEFLLEDILEEEDDDDESGFFDKNTTDRFFIDDVYYLLDEDTVEMEFIGLVGVWDAKNDGEMTFSSEYTSHTTIANSLTHDLKINQSWRIPDKNEEMELSLSFPTGYGAIDWDVVANISMNGSNPWVIVPGANPNPGYHDEDEHKTEGVDYVWAHTFVNRTYDIIDNSDVQGFCGEVLNFSLEITEWVVVKSVSLEYRLLGEPNFNKVTPENFFGTYTYNLSIPKNEERDIDYRFIIEITPDFKLAVPHEGTKGIEIVDGIDPIVILEPPPKWVNIGTKVYFDASGSYDNIDIARYNFSFGDGSYLKSSSASAEHIYIDMGIFKMVVEVTDYEGNAANTSFELNVVNDNNAPEVLSTVPESGAVDVDPGTPIEVIFSEDLDALTIDIELAGIGYDYSYNNTDNYTLKINVDGSLAWGTQYIITLNAADLVGNWLNGYKFNFTIITFEKYDADGDGYPNGDDAFPANPTGAMDTDTDGKPDTLLNATGWNGTLIEDLDDDNDNWTDELELMYGTNPKDPSEFPADLDGDHIPDIDDPDIDGDGVPNNKDEDPYDATVGEEEEDDYLWAIIAVVVIVIVIIVIIVFLMFLRPRFKKRGQEQPLAQPSKQPDGPPGPIPGLQPSARPGEPRRAEPVVGAPVGRPETEGQPVPFGQQGEPRLARPVVAPPVVGPGGGYPPTIGPKIEDGKIVEEEDDDELETY